MAGPSRPPRAVRLPPKHPSAASPPLSRVSLPRAGSSARDALRRRSLELLKKISDKDKFAIFLEPVPLDDVPGYTDVIARPMDLGTVKKNVAVGVYHSPHDLRADLDLIWANCTKFNAVSTIYHKEAVRLRALSGKFFEEYLRFLGKDGLPYGPRAATTTKKIKSTHSIANGQLAGASGVADDGNAAALYEHTTVQRLRNVARARTKVLQARRNTPDTPITPLEASAENTVDALIPKPEKHQIYDGPYQRLRRFPNAHAANTFPFVQGSKLQKALQPFPHAWQTLGKHQHDTSNLSYNQRMNEMAHANQYQSFVSKSAPIARRLLATILDPMAVVEHDAAVARNQSKSAPKKRPRHGEIHPTHTNMEISVRTPEKTPTVPPMPSDEAVRDLQDVLKLHNIDSSFLTTILNPPNTEKPAADSMEISPVKHIASEFKSKLKSPTPRQSAVDDEEKTDAETRNPSPVDDAKKDAGPIVKAGEIDAAPTEPSGNLYGKSDVLDKTAPVPPEQAEDADENESDSEESDSESENGESDADEELAWLLESNHNAMQNILRLRALKEVALGQARTDLEAEEAHCISVLVETMAKSTMKLTPRMLLPKVQAGIMLMDKARGIIGRKRKMDEKEDAEKAKKKGKNVQVGPPPTSTPTPTTQEATPAVANGVAKPVVNGVGIGVSKNANVTAAATGKMNNGKKMSLSIVNGNGNKTAKNPAVASQVDKVTAANLAWRRKWTQYCAIHKRVER